MADSNNDSNERRMPELHFEPVAPVGNLTAFRWYGADVGEGVIVAAVDSNDRGIGIAFVPYRIEFDELLEGVELRPFEPEPSVPTPEVAPEPNPLDEVAPPPAGESKTIEVAPDKPFVKRTKKGAAGKRQTDASDLVVDDVVRPADSPSGRWAKVVAIEQLDGAVRLTIEKLVE